MISASENFLVESECVFFNRRKPPTNCS